MSGSLYDAAGQKHNVDPLLLQAIATVESGERDNAVGVPTRYGTAKGRMQFIDETAGRYGVKDPHDPAQSVPAAANYISDLLNRHGAIAPAMLAYSGGEAAYPGKVAAAYERLKGQAMDKAKTVNRAPDDNSDILDMPVKDSGSGSGEVDNSDILDMPVKDAPTSDANREAQRKTIREAFGNKEVSNSMATESNDNPIDENRMPSFSTQAKASLAAGTDQRRRILASQIFPGMPLNEALSRIYPGPDGRSVAIDKNGNRFYIEPPSATGRSEIVPGIPSVSATNLARNIVPSLGAAIPMVTGGVASLAAGPGSLFAGPGLAAGGAAIGDAARQWGASAFDPGSQPYDYHQTMQEGIQAAGGQLLGAGVSRVMVPNKLMVPSGDIRLAKTGPVLAQAQEAYDRAAAQGVDLSPGQASGLRSLLGYEDQAKINPAFTDAAGNFYQRQGNQLQAAGNRLLDNIAPAADKTDAALLFQQGAQDTTRGVRQDANAAARPFYEAAQTEGNVSMPAKIGELMDTPAMKDAMNKAQIEYANFYHKPAPWPPDFQLWDMTKRKLDDAQGIAARAGENTSAAGIDNLRASLRGYLDEAFPSYAKARAAAEPGHRLAARLEDTATGKIAGQTGDERVRSIVDPMFRNNNPVGIATARDAFMKSGQEDAWHSGVRAYVQDAIDQASESQNGLNPAMLLRKVWGNKDVRDNLQAAMTPNQFKGFDAFLSTVEDMSRTYPVNSLTAMRDQAKAGMIDAASNTFGNKLIRGIGMVGSPQTLMRGLSVITDVGDKALTNRNMRNVMGNLFSPDGMAMLENMSRVTPGSSQARGLSMQVLSRGAPDLPTTANDATGLQGLPQTNRLAPPSR